MDSNDLVEVIITEVSIDKASQASMVVLREKQGTRWFPIYVGPFEAHNITFILRGEAYPRPLTFDTLVNLLTAAGGEVRRVAVTDLHDNTFFATIELQRLDGVAEVVDARPSDAIPLALKMNLPIFVANDVLNRASRQPNPRPLTKEEQIRELEEEMKRAVAAEDYEKAAHLRDRIKEIKRSRDE